ncbi:hypothetical protein [Shinella sp.]|uniref:hypothetical protein n=1 Tax=Shinella sp. TaxID=1870904 RepID=UPI00301DA320
MKPKLLHPGVLFVGALVFMVLALPLARPGLQRLHDEGLHQALLRAVGMQAGPTD